MQLAHQTIDFFLPGPTWVREDVLEAMTRPLVGHRSAAFKALYGTLSPRLQQVFRTRGDVMLATGSATLVMESAVISTVDSEILHLIGGAFAERWYTISRTLGKRPDRLEAPWGEAIAPELVRTALRRKRYEAVTVTHSETSTGVLCPLQEIARVVREESDALLLVDAVSSLAGAPLETDDWGLDLVLASTQKALAAPPGLTAFSLSERAADRASRIERRGFYTDLLRYREQHRKSSTITTPAISVAYALDRQLDVILEEGIETRWARHAALQAMTADWARAGGFAYASASGARSPTISCLRPPDGCAAPDLVERLSERGLVVGSGYGRWKPGTFRIGHMGEVRARDLEALLGAIGELVSTG